MRLSKQEAATRLGVSTATIERRIQRGELQAEQEPHGTRYRVWVIFDEESPVETDVETQSPQVQPVDATSDATPPPAEPDPHVEVVRLQEQLKSAQQRADGLEELAGFHRQALTDAEWRYHGILMELRQCQQNLAAVTRALPAPQDSQKENPTIQPRRRRFWWPFAANFQHR